MTLDAPLSPALTAPQPNPPSRQYSFTDFQVNNPSAPPPGDRLDGEYDRTNQALADTIAWAATSLNSDGSLKPQSVGKSELQLGLFDEIWASGEARVAPLVGQTQDAARAAWTAAEVADASALAAGGQNQRVQEAAGRASTEAQDAANSAAEAAQSALEAEASATNSLNSANHADLAEATCIDYGVLTQAWAEHMPDTIPPNILAVMDVTGDHWSSRWWANRAHLIVEEDTANAICELQNYWMGAYPAPPLVNNCGEPVVAGAMYYNTTEQVSQVYDGAFWHDVTQPVPGQITEYLYLPAVPTTVFSGVDYHGNVLTLDPVSAEIGVYLNGVKLLEGLDYSISTSAVTMLLGSVTAPNTVEIMSVNDLTNRPPAQGVKVNTTPWVFNGITTTFPLADSVGAVINPPGAVDCIVSLNGVIQEAGGDFVVNPGFITFSTPPEADADRWMVVGVPLGGAGGGITQLTGDVLAGPGSGPAAAVLAPTAVAPGSYTNASLTVDQKGRLTAASSGAAPAAALVPHPGYRAGAFYTRPMSAVGTNVAVIANRIYAAPIFIAAPLTIDAVHIFMGTPGAGGTLAAIGLYANANGAVGSLIKDFGTVSTASGTGLTIAGTQAVAAGWYFLAAAFSGTPSIVSSAATDVSQQHLLGFATLAGSFQGFQGWVATWTFSAGNMPVNLATPAQNNGSFPLIAFRVQ